MKRRSQSRGKRRDGEGGVVIILVAVVMLFIVGAMAALSIDVVTLYTARSEAQLAADGAALAGARIFANSGVTSDASRRSTRNARTLATNIATQVASQNMVGGRLLQPSEITVTFNQTDPAFDTNPHVTVQVQRTDVPTFFARIWGRTANTVTASATAEAYNPSDANALSLGSPAIPVAPLCVKPWLLPNLDPTGATGNTIFDPSTGAITAANLVGQSWPGPGNANGLFSLCGGDCSAGNILPPTAGGFYPGSAASFPPPTTALPSGTAGFNPYQLAVAGCVQIPISCGVNSATNNSSVSIDNTTYLPVNGSRDADTVAAASVLIHYVSAAGDSDSVDPATTRPPLQFIAGNQNPIATAIGSQVMVSDSLVTLPVIDTSPAWIAAPTYTVNVIGFLQVFLNPSATSTIPYTGGTSLAPIPNEIPAMIINMAGCGNTATGPPIFGNGASPVAVRLITPP